jgi:hypothetical protein
MKMKVAVMTFLVLAIVVSTLSAAAASAASNPVTRFPANTGFAGQGQFRQGMQTGAASQFQRGGLAGGAANVPAGTGFSPQGQFQQGMQTGAPGQMGGAGSLTQTVPGTGQQQGAGIVAGDFPAPKGPSNPAGSPSTIGGVQGGPGTCYCITAPCNCGGTGSGTGAIPPAQVPQSTSPLQPMNQQFLNQPLQGQQLQTQPLQTQQFQTQPLQAQQFPTQPFQPLSAPAGNVLPGSVQTRQF